MDRCRETSKAWPARLGPGSADASACRSRCRQVRDFGCCLTEDPRKLGEGSVSVLVSHHCYNKLPQISGLPKFILEFQRSEVQNNSYGVTIKVSAELHCSGGSREEPLPRLFQPLEASCSPSLTARLPRASLPFLCSLSHLLVLTLPFLPPALFVTLRF